MTLYKVVIDGKDTVDMWYIVEGTSIPQVMAVTNETYPLELIKGIEKLPYTGILKSKYPYTSAWKAINDVNKIIKGEDNDREDIDRKS